MKVRRVLVGAITAAVVLALATPVVRAQVTNEDRVRALVGLARVKRDAGDMPAARRYFDEAARLRPLTPNERSEYFWILQAVDAEAAYAAGRTVLRGSPSDLGVRDRTIELAITLGREDLVVALAEEGARVQPATARWPRRLGESYLRQRRPLEAELALSRAVALADATDADRTMLAMARHAQLPDLTTPTPSTEPKNVTARPARVAPPRTAKPAALPAPVHLGIAQSTVEAAQSLIRQLTPATVVVLDSATPPLPVPTLVEDTGGRADEAEALRLQARMAGWAGQTDLALARYAALAARFPDSPAIAAERDAKSAFLTGRWQTAADAYRRLIVLEPDNGEARLEYAQALRAAGHVREADAALQELVDSSLHEMAPDVWARAQRTRRPRMALVFDSRAAAGFGGQRLLERQTEEGAFLATGGSTAATQFDLSAGRATLRGADDRRHGYHALLGLSSRLSPRVDIAARADVWDVWQNGDAAIEGALQLRYRVADRWTLTGGFDRSLLFENLEVVDRRLAATGVNAGLRFESPTAGFEAGAGMHQLSDGNARWRASMFYNRVITQRLRNLRALVWAEVLSFREPSPLYYSPQSQIRLDVGAQYTHDLRLQRFRGDRVNAITGAYLIGTDRDGIIYHHPSLRASFELGNGLAFETRADWIRSAVYNDRSLSFGLAFRSAGPGR